MYFRVTDALSPSPFPAAPSASVQDYRQVLTNGVAWAAGVEIPEGDILSPDPPSESVPSR